MPSINDAAKDAALNWIIANASEIHVCSSEPANYAAVAGVSLGVKTGITMGAIADGAPDGRQTSTPSFSDGVASASGTGSHYAITDGAAELIAAGPLDATQPITSGNPFGLAALAIRLRDATIPA